VVVLLGALGVYMAVAQPTGTSALAAPVPPPPDSANRAPAPTDPNPPTGYPVSADEAASIALSNAPGAALAQEPRLVNINGTIAYEVALDRGYVYVDANSGQVLYNSAAGTNQPRRRGRR
jgi:hypothetical protein